MELAIHCIGSEPFFNLIINDRYQNLQQLSKKAVFKQIIECKQVFGKLMTKNHSEEAKKPIAIVISNEIPAVMKSLKSFNLEIYLQVLNQLPKLPFD